MRYLSRNQRDRYIDNLIAEERRLKREGKEHTEEFRKVRERIAELEYGSRNVA